MILDQLVRLNTGVSQEVIRITIILACQHYDSTRSYIEL